MAEKLALLHYLALLTHVCIPLRTLVLTYHTTVQAAKEAAEVFLEITKYR